MPKEKKGPYGMSVGKVPFEDRKALESLNTVPEELDIQLTQELFEEYFHNVNLYLHDTSQGKRPSLSEVKDYLKKLQQTSQEFIDAIKMFDHPSVGRLLLIESDNPTSKKREAIAIAQFIDESSRQSLISLSDKKGKRPIDIALYNLVIGLARIFFESTGKRPTRSHSESDEDTTKFVKFVSNSLKHVNRPPTSDSSLSKQISRIFKRTNFPT